MTRLISKPSPTLEWGNFHSPHTRTFHLSWFAFLVSFLAWFGLAPFTEIIRLELNLTHTQITQSMVASVASTIFARLILGWLCDKYGPRIIFSSLLVIIAIPIFSVIWIQGFWSLLIVRFLIGIIGATFVLNQFHVSKIYTTKCVGIATATSAGWGNLGGGISQVVMPFLLSIFLYFGFSEFWSWRAPMFLIGIICIITGIIYYLYASDPPPVEEIETEIPTSSKSIFIKHKVWLLFLAYAACFGIELTINNIAIMYFSNNFHLELQTAGIIAGSFGLMNIFARSLGGHISDRCFYYSQTKGRQYWLVAVLACEAISILIFSALDQLIPAIIGLIIFSLCVQMSQGATFSIVPSINPRQTGKVAGLVGSGGNVGAVCASLLFVRDINQWNQILFILGIIVLCISILNLGLLIPHEKPSASPFNYTPAKN